LSKPNRIATIKHLGEGVMPTSQQSWVEFVIEGVIGWIWIAASLAAVYFLVSAVFFGGGWWRAVASVAAAWLQGYVVLSA
jgi:hypothetical protein